jgi:protein TonB
MRYTSSMFVATILSLLIFLGMSLLIANPKHTKSTNIEMVDFSKIADATPPTVKPTKKTPPPKPAKAKQPPVAPPLDIANTTGRPDIKMTPHNFKNTDFTVAKFNNPNITNPSAGPLGDGNTSLRQIIPIQPVYPQIALRNKVEGWVKVEFIVNEFGKVINAKVIDAMPKRVFNVAAIKALSKSKFKPLMINGKATSQTAVQVIEFKIEK